MAPIVVLEGAQQMQYRRYLSVRCDGHLYLLIYKGLLKNCHLTYCHSCCQEWLTLYVPAGNIDIEKTAFRDFTPFFWNNLQSKLKLEALTWGN